jgi:hypothetical protein
MKKLQKNKIWKDVESLGENPVVTSFMKDGKIIGVSFTNSSADFEIMLRDHFYMQLGISDNMIDFIKSQTPEQIEELKRLSQIDFHKREIERLNRVDRNKRFDPLNDNVVFCGKNGTAHSVDCLCGNCHR